MTADPLFVAGSPERTEFAAETAAAVAVRDWIDANPSNGVRRSLIGCTPSMVAGIAVNAYRRSLRSDIPDENLPGNVTPDSKVLARDLSLLIDRYLRDAASTTQRNSISNLANVLRWSMAINLQLSTQLADAMGGLDVVNDELDRALYRADHPEVTR